MYRLTSLRGLESAILSPTLREHRNNDLSAVEAISSAEAKEEVLGQHSFGLHDREKTHAPVSFPADSTKRFMAHRRFLLTESASPSKGQSVYAIAYR